MFIDSSKTGITFSVINKNNLSMSTVNNVDTTKVLDRADFSALSKKLFDKVTNTDMVDAVIDDVLDYAKMIEKPNEKMDDIQWGTLVKLGKSMGMTDGKMIEKLSTDDVKRYFHEFAEKDNIDGAERQYETSEEFWNAVFTKDSFGSVERNKDFKFTYFEPENPDEGYMSVRDMGTNVDLSKIDPGNIYKLAKAVEKKDRALLKDTLVKIDIKYSHATDMWQPDDSEDDVHKIIMSAALQVMNKIKKENPSGTTQLLQYKSYMKDFIRDETKPFSNITLA